MKNLLERLRTLPNRAPGLAAGYCKSLGALLGMAILGLIMLFKVSLSLPVLLPLFFIPSITWPFFHRIWLRQARADKR